MPTTTTPKPDSEHDRPVYEYVYAHDRPGSILDGEELTPVRATTPQEAEQIIRERLSCAGWTGPVRLVKCHPTGDRRWVRSA